MLHADALAEQFGAAQDRLRNSGPAAKQSEGVTDADECGVLIGANCIEQREGRRFPSWIFLDLRLPAPQIFMRVQVAGTARADVKAESTVMFGHNHAVTHVKRKEPNGNVIVKRRQLRRQGTNSAHDTVVAHVEPTMIHIEHGNVNEPLISRRQISNTLYARKLKHLRRFPLPFL